MSIEFKGKPRWIAEDWLKDQICAGATYLSGAALQQHLKEEGYEIENRIVYDFLFEMMKEGRIDARGMVICKSNEIHQQPEILLDRIFERREDGAIALDLGDAWDNDISCPKCNKTIHVHTDTVFIVFSPTDRYKHWLIDSEKNPLSLRNRKNKAV
jgi:hypothetical protein